MGRKEDVVLYGPNGRPMYDDWGHVVYKRWPTLLYINGVPQSTFFSTLADRYAYWPTFNTTKTTTKTTYKQGAESEPIQETETSTQNITTTLDCNYLVPNATFSGTSHLSGTWNYNNDTDTITGSCSATITGGMLIRDQELGEPYSVSDPFIVIRDGKSYEARKIAYEVPIDILFSLSSQNSRVVGVPVGYGEILREDMSIASMPCFVLAFARVEMTFTAWEVFDVHWLPALSSYKGFGDNGAQGVSCLSKVTMVDYDVLSGPLKALAGGSWLGDDYTSGDRPRTGLSVKTTAPDAGHDPTIYLDGVISLPWTFSLGY